MSKISESRTSSSEAAHASLFPLPEPAPDSRERLDSCGNMFERFAMSGLSGFFGRTSRERSQARMGRISDACSEAWMTSGMVWHGGYLTRSSSEYPSDADVSFLSDVLEPAPPLEVLFEPEGMRRDYQPSREKRQELASAAGRGPSCAGFKYSAGSGASSVGYEEENSNTLTADWHAPAVIGFAQNTRDEVRIQGDGTLSGALSAQPGMKQQTYVAEVCGSPCAAGSHGDGNQLVDRDKAVATGEPVVCMTSTTSNAAVDVECAGTLLVAGDHPIISAGRE